jgi:2,3-bisphosphoglycerate-independent phosphoglycerate mutase
LKILLVVFDGLGDRPSPVLHGLTPLEAAHTPNLDRLAAAGASGRFWAVEPWLPVGTAMAHHVMFGYSPEDFADRAVLMALARGYPPARDEVVFAARFASVVAHHDRFELRERFIRDEDDCTQLAVAISNWSHDGLDFSYRYCGRGDGLLTLRGQACAEITDTDPLGLDLPVIEAQPLEDSSAPDLARRVAHAMNSYLNWVHQTLEEHEVALRRKNSGRVPVNMLITKWGGQLRELSSFQDLHGLRAAGIPAEEIVDGVQRAAGMEVFKMERAGDVAADLSARLDLAFDLFSRGFDFVNVHTKEPDAIAHWSDPPRKRETIHGLDEGLVGTIDQLCNDPGLVVAVTGDHCTPSSWEGLELGNFNDQHSGEALPIIVRGPHVPVDTVTTFGERSSPQGALGTVLGPHLMQMLLTFADRTNVAGVRPTPRLTSYRPKSVRPLTPLRPAVAAQR